MDLPPVLFSHNLPACDYSQLIKQGDAKQVTELSIGEVPGLHAKESPVSHTATQPLIQGAGAEVEAGGKVGLGLR